MAEKILVVEDEESLSETLVYNLKRQGYEVEAVADGVVALSLARELKPDLILLDIMLPGLDGLEITRILRKESGIPILILTAQGGEIDRVLGLELGADDYMPKPFSMRELLARVKALLRRIQLDKENKTNLLETRRIFGNMEIDPNKHEIILDDKALKLKPKEYDLLVYLANHRGSVLTRNRILEEVWGWDFAGGTRTVDVHIRWLREKIEPVPTAPIRIITVHGVGYRFDG